MNLLAKEFAMKDLGPLSFFLGIAVNRPTPHTLFLSQQKYALELLQRAGLEHCNPAVTPVDTNSKLSTNSGTPLDDPTEYRQLVGALQYLTLTRPDISYAVQQVCMHMHAPRSSHMNALKRILRYVRGTIAHGLTIQRSTTHTLLAYTDADWAGCPDTRRSTSGFCVYLGDNLISWSSKRQPTVSRSSAEAEYRAVANVVSDTCWIRNLLCELRSPPDKATLIYCDNVSAVYLSTNPIQHQRTKHIEIDIHFVREKVARGQVRVLHVPSRYQIADIFTKGLPRILFDDFRSSLNIRDPPTSFFPSKLLLTKPIYLMICRSSQTSGTKLMAMASTSFAGISALPLSQPKLTAIQLPSKERVHFHKFSTTRNPVYSTKECHGLTSRKMKSVAPRCSNSSSPDGATEGSSNKTKVPFGYSRKDVIFIGLGVTFAGIGLKSGLEFLGVDPLQAGNVVQLVLVLGLTLGWISTYLFRVSNKEMTYAQQLRDYESKVMEKRLEGLSEAELEALLEQVEEEKRLASSD
ncbi:hypothetical protein SSX86_010566 [Deinandra increscens subsp. villosa]|uniref:Uncharacterized protein n=1 Tax=Deinandra increscens subsp. villosa TaxID=3103831 RepID=A0AAP0D7S2_9ASTR